MKTKKISIKNKFNKDYISREAGEKLRLLILESEKNNHKTEIDFTDLIIASTSFFDEAFAKLALEDWDSNKLKTFVTLKGMNKRDYKVLMDVCEYRNLNLPLNWIGK